MGQLWLFKATFAQVKSMRSAAVDLRILTRKINGGFG